MSKTTGLLGALGVFGALAYLMAPLPPEQQRAAVVTTASTDVVAPAAANPQPVARLAPSAPAPRQDAAVRLVQQIQTELLRLGCYNGAVDGRWTTETQQAMQTLGERVRVLRPVDTPDYIMLALARSQVSHLCAPRDQAAVSRQPARIVPMAGPWDTKTERARAASVASPRRQAERSPPAAEAQRARAANPSERRTFPESASGPLSDDDPMLSRDRRDGDHSRMSLGVATADPLRAGMDPRDPTAPAILRGPAPVTSRTAGQGASSEIDAAQAPRRAQRSAPTVSRRGDWKRTVFNKMKYDGP